MSSAYEVGIGPRGSITRDSAYEWGGLVSSRALLEFTLVVCFCVQRFGKKLRGKGPQYFLSVLKAGVPVQVFGNISWGSGGGSEYDSSSSPCLSAWATQSGAQARQGTVHR